jgi:TonB family protein
MKRALVVLIVLCCALTAGKSQSRLPYATAIYAPKPQYPAEARQHGWLGSGLFMCKLRPDGTVSSVTVLKSTGHDVLDQSGIAAFRQWRFKPGQAKDVEIPISFVTGGGVRSRMAGAVLDRAY